jgi:viologen exporter family transport system permease protein
VGRDLALVGRHVERRLPPQIITIAALAAAGFRRYATYRQATVASAFTNSIFGFLRCSVLLAAVAGSATGVAAGYHPAQLATYCWVSQGLIGVVMIWGWTELGDRIRTGDVVGDLLRPLAPVLSYLAVDLGRAAYACLTRLVVPIVVGAVFFDLYAPRRLITYPLCVLSTMLAVVVCFACRYVVNAAAFWMLDVRGANLAWTFISSVLTGLAFPLHFLPSWVVVGLRVGTPFPSILQTPLDVLVERGSPVETAGVIAAQVAWAALLLAGCVVVQRRAERRLVIQGG